MFYTFYVCGMFLVDLVCMVSNLVSVQQFQQLKEKEEKVHTVICYSKW